MSVWGIDGGVGAWIATFAVHGAAWLVFGLVLTRCWRGIPEAVEEWLWRGALLGALIGPSVSGAMREAPLQVGTPVAAEAVSDVPSLPVGFTVTATDDDVPVAVAAPDPATERQTAASESNRETNNWDPLVLWGACGLAVLGILRHGWQRVRLRRLLDGRRPADAALRAELAELAGRGATPRLTLSDAIRSPIAFGWRRPEICLPAAAVSVSRGVRRGMLAHEFAHVRRRDPLWLGAVRLLRAGLFWHPLVHVAYQRLQDVAERRADEWAADRVGARSVAKGLVQAAEWVAREPQVLTFAVSMAGGVLTRRIDLLLADGKRSDRIRDWVVATCVGLGTFGSLAEFVPGPAWASRTVAAEASTAIALAGDGSVSSYDTWLRCGVVLEQVAVEQAEVERRLAALAGEPQTATDGLEIAELRARLERLSKLQGQAGQLMDRWASAIREEQDGSQSGSDNERKQR